MKNIQKLSSMQDILNKVKYRKFHFEANKIEVLFVESISATIADCKYPENVLRGNVRDSNTSGC